ncbi:helix-turn-helix transcriptional regulator [Rhizorhabdus argentea]|uniref:helix-turn-helix transcriptional regulator n=1 Tax=Rhizorhabdus argentea TaxID=1387174 RepID=UPI0030ECE85C
MGAALEIDDIVSRIYRDANCDDSWESSLSAIREFFDAGIACLRIANQGGKCQQFLFATGPTLRRDILAEWEVNNRGGESSSVLSVGEVRVLNWERDLPGQPIVNELREFDVVTSIAHCFQNYEGQTYTINITRGENSPAFTDDDIANVRRIGRNFAEASILRHEMLRSNLTSRFQAQVLDRLSVAGILVDPYGNVLPLNDGAEKLLSKQEVLKRRRCGQLIAIDRANDRELQGHLSRIFSGAVEYGAAIAVSLDRGSGERPLGLIITSTRSMCIASNREEICALLFIRDADVTSAIEPSLLQKLFNFTPAEANLAIGLASGKRLVDIERSLKIRHNTARAHLRSMFLKADVSRQAELVRLLTTSVAQLGRKEKILN